jgi:hypothetical protein
MANLITKRFFVALSMYSEQVCYLFSEFHITISQKMSLAAFFFATFFL